MSISLYFACILDYATNITTTTTTSTSSITSSTAEASMNIPSSSTTSSLSQQGSLQYIYLTCRCRISFSTVNHCAGLSPWIRPRTDPVTHFCSTLAQHHWPDPVQAVHPGVQVTAQHGAHVDTMVELCRLVSNIVGHQHLWSADRGQLYVPRVWLSSVDIRRMCVQSCRSVCLELFLWPS